LGGKGIVNGKGAQGVGEFKTNLEKTFRQGAAEGRKGHRCKRLLGMPH